MTATKTAPAAVLSQFLGEIVPVPGSELILPVGLPGFENERTLLPVEIPDHRPLVFLQSPEDPATCFVCLPVSSIDPAFHPEIPEDDRIVLDIELGRELVMGEDVLCLALLLPLPGSVRVNLDAPIVINLRNYRCAQVLSGPCNGVRRLSPEGVWEREC